MKSYFKIFIIGLLVGACWHLSARDIPDKTQCEYNSAVAPETVTLTSVNVLDDFMSDVDVPVPISTTYSMGSLANLDEYKISFAANFAVVQNQNFDRMYKF